MAIYLDDQVQNGKAAVLKYLQLPANAIPTVSRKELEILGGTRDKDGMLRVPKSIYGVAEYIVFVPMLGREVKVRLAMTQRPNKNKGFDYAPKNIGIEPAEDGSVLITDEIEFLFWFLRPMCSNSPFYSANTRAYYTFKDNVAKASAEQDLEEKRIDALSLIYGVNRKTYRELRTLAKGMNIPGVDDMEDVVVQSVLKKQAYADPVKFYGMATSREIIFNGKIQEAIEADILKVENKNGMKRWYLLGDEILPLQNGMDDVHALKEFLSAQWYLYADVIQNALDKKTVATNLNTADNNVHFEDHQVPEVKAELNASFLDALKELEKDERLKEKIVKLASIDPENPAVHHKTRESYKENQNYIDAYKESLKGL